MDDYLREVTEQIRNKKAKAMVKSELLTHIEEQTAAYENAGFHKEEALRKAVEEMGDPVAVGMEMDRIHQPRFPWKMVCLIFVISLISILTQFILTRDLGDPFSTGLFWRHLLFTLAGTGMMLGVCALDYTLIGKYGKWLAVLFLAVLFTCWEISHLSINGADRWLSIGSFSFDGSILALLYLPLFGGILYAYRGQGYKGIAKIMAWLLMPVVFVLRMPALSIALLIFFTEVGMFMMALKDGWYQVNAKRTALITLTVPTMAAMAAIMYGIRGMGLANYQTDRLRAWVLGTGPAGYLLSAIRSVFRQCDLIGKSLPAMQTLENLPDHNQDFVIVSMAARFGIVPAFSVLVLLAVLFLWMFWSVRKQKNCLGKMVGAGSMIAVMLQLILNITMIFGWLPMTTMSVPFLSYTGSGTLVTYILLGIILSIHRNKDIVRDPEVKRAFRHQEA